MCISLLLHTLYHHSNKTSRLFLLSTLNFRYVTISQLTLYMLKIYESV